MQISHQARDWLTLSFLPGLGCGLVNRLVDTFGSPEDVLTAGRAVRQVRGVGGRVATVLADRGQLARARRQAEKTLEFLDRQQISLVCRDDPSYPALLRTIAEPPPALYCRGNLTSLDATSVAIVGSRAATSYGNRCSFVLARGLAQCDVTVVSGVASGIDGRAHCGAIAGQGMTVGVLGCGVDVVYPRSHGELYEQIAASGALVSEYPPGTRPEGFRFPARNRIISGLVHGVVVVEATLRSGSLITARLALDQGREVFAVPGRIDSSRSAGTHRLLQQGAHLVHTVDDIIGELDLAAAIGKGTIQSVGPAVPELTDAEQHLLACLDVYAQDIDTIMRRSGFDAGHLHDLLFRLEMQGLIRQLPGQQYELQSTS